MARKLRFFALVILVLVVAWGGLLAGQKVTSQLFAVTIEKALADEGEGKDVKKKETQKDRYKNLELFQKVLHFVENNYVDDVKNEELVVGAIKGLMSTLDPHSNFLTPEIFKDMKIDTSGKFGGLGIEISVQDNILTVIAPIEDTPAWKAGLQPGDRIVKINEESTKGMNLQEAVVKMRGIKGTAVTLTIYREGFENLRPVKIVRDIIKIRSVKYEILENGYGYLRLTNFNESAAKDLHNAVTDLEKKNGKLKGLVFDLRTNPGGLLDQAVDVTSMFLSEGVVVSTIGRDRDTKEVKHVRKGQAREDLSLAVLVNSSTASAAEIVAGALQDHGRAVVIGQPTFGKGSVQTVIDLGDDMGLKLTIARYYTPSGRSIQEKGVVPDILLDQYDPKLLKKALLSKDVTREKDLTGHLVNEDSSADYTLQDLESLGKQKPEDGKNKSKEADEPEGDDMTPLKYNPKEDYQVKEALNYLKSYSIFKKIEKRDATETPGPVSKTPAHPSAWRRR